MSAAKPLPHVVARDAFSPTPTKRTGAVKVKRTAVAGEPDWGRAMVAMMKGSLCLFADEVLGLEIGPHMLAWEDLVLHNQRVAINAARDHSKSTFFSYAYPIWRAWSEPGCEVYIFSKTQEQAIEFLDIIVNGRRNLVGLMDLPGLSHLIPRDKQGNARMKKTDIKLTNGSRIRAVGYGKAIRGAHPKYIVLDDPLNDEDMWSETQRDKHIEYFKSAIVNMAPPDGQICVVGTPYHVADLYGWLRGNREYVFRRFPGIVKDKLGNERPLFPWKWSLAALHGKKREIGAVSFAREILCEPITDDIAIFPSWLFPRNYDKNLVIRPSRATIEAMGLSVFFGIDIARSASVGADYFVIFCQGRDDKGNRYLLDIQKWRGLGFNDQLKKIEMAHQRYLADLVFVESNAMQQVWSDELRRTTDVPIKEFVTTATNKYPLDKGVPSLRILLENEKMIIPRGDAESRRVTDSWIEECTQFGYVDGKLQGIGKHDDQVMAWWFAEEATKRGGFSFTFGEGDEDEIVDEMMGGDVDWEAEMLGTDEDDSL